MPGWGGDRERDGRKLDPRPVTSAGRWRNANNAPLGTPSLSFVTMRVISHTATKHRMVVLLRFESEPKMAGGVIQVSTVSRWFVTIL